MADHHEAYDDHGHSTAAWTGVVIMLVAAVAACWGVAFGPLWLLYAGLAVFAAGGLVWYVMDKIAQGPRGDEPAHTGAPITPPAATRGGQQG